jgi:uncharacterized membrane protein YhaH (DUF805 family)
MTMAWLFFSFDGRINRAIWWAVIGGTFSLDIGLFMLTVNGMNATIYSVSGLIIFALRLAPSAKRLHDRNKSAWWLLAYFALPELLFLLIIPQVGQIDVTMATILIAIVVWMIIDLGILPGTLGANRYGPDPLAGPMRPGGLGPNP